MGRRRFLNTLKKMGFSGAAIAGLSQETLAEVTGDINDRVPHLKAYKHTNHEEIKQGKPPEREEEYVSIPRDQWVRYRTAQSARKRISKRVNDYENISVGITSESKTSDKLEIGVTYETHLSKDGKKRRQPNISSKELHSKLPSKAKGVVGKRGKSRSFPVVIEKEEIEEQATFNSKYRPIPGGCQTERENLDMGTLACKAYSYDDEEFVMVTAGHLTEGILASQHQPSQWGDSFSASTETINSGDKDCGFIRINDSHDIAYKIADKNGGYRDFYVGGTYSHDELVHKKSTSQTLEFQGRTTGKHTTLIDRITPKKIRLYSDCKKGDSGGPYYGIEGEYCYIAGVHAWGTSTEGADGINRSKGNKMIKVEQWLNLDT